MELHGRVFKVALASAIGLFAVMGAQEESSASSHRYLCTSVPSACEYTPDTVPGYKADVCWDGSAAYVMPAGGCVTGMWPYFLEAGEVVDPVTNRVQGYIPLDDGCDLGYCVVKPPGAGPTEPGPMCCGSNGCSTVQDGTCSNSNDTLLWCFDGEEPTQQNGEWVCYETD